MERRRALNSELLSEREVQIVFFFFSSIFSTSTLESLSTLTRVEGQFHLNEKV